MASMLWGECYRTAAHRHWHNTTHLKEFSFLGTQVSLLAVTAQRLLWFKKSSNASSSPSVEFEKPFSASRVLAPRKSTRMRARTAASSSSCVAGIARSASIQSSPVGSKPLRMCREKKLRQTCEEKSSSEQKSQQK